jgi:hypothetical protein
MVGDLYLRIVGGVVSAVSHCSPRANPGRQAPTRVLPCSLLPAPCSCACSLLFARQITAPSASLSSHLAAAIPRLSLSSPASPPRPSRINTALLFQYQNSTTPLARDLPPCVSVRPVSLHPTLRATCSRSPVQLLAGRKRHLVPDTIQRLPFHMIPADPAFERMHLRFHRPGPSLSRPASEDFLWSWTGLGPIRSP